MLSSLFRSNQKYFQGAAILAVTSFLSYILGLVRDRLFASTFGAGIELDTYNAAFIIPDLLLNIFVAGALQAAFLPIFTSVFQKKGEKEAFRLANIVLNSALLAMIVLGGVAMICMPPLSPLVAPGWNDMEQKILFVKLSRLLLISPLVFAISNTFGAVLMSRRNYFWYGMSPVLYNLGIITGTFFLSPYLGITGVVLGTIFGSFLHLGIRLIGMKRLHFAYQYVWNFKDEAFQKIIKLMLPKMFGHPAEQLSFWAFTGIASTLAAGSVTMISFARNFMSVPVSLFGIAFATASFPILASAASDEHYEAFVSHFWKSLKKILLITIPSALVLGIFGKIFVNIFLGGGKFSPDAVATTAMVLAIFSLSIPFESVSHLFARSFYALKNTLLPVIFSLLGLIIAVGFAYFTKNSFGITALPLGFFAGSVVKIILSSVFLFILINKRKKTTAS